MNDYDYIIAGAGAAGLSLAVHLIRSGKFSDKRILLLDKSKKETNDRTWCFWEKDPGPFEDVVFKRWEQLYFTGIDGLPALHDIRPYQYKLVRGLDFYRYCLNIIENAPNVTIKTGSVERCYSGDQSAYAVVDGRTITARYIFNSIIFDPQEMRKARHFLLQHFRGWYIQSEKEVFDAGKAILMDFSISQQHGTSFVYTMPFSGKEALIEYTIFSGQLLQESQYESALGQYVTSKFGLEVGSYTILSRETGMIPMTDHTFRGAVGNVVNIGTAGGHTRPSSGYTFSFIQKNSEAIVTSLLHGNTPSPYKHPAKSRFYDSILLHLLAKKKMGGDEIFTRLFQTNHMKDVFRFLDNETTLAEDYAIIRHLPHIPFLKAALANLGSIK